MTDVTQILAAIDRGESQAAEQLLPLVYGELRRLAAKKLAQEKPGQTLQATALVHEAYLRLVDAERSWENRGHFFAAAGRAMRRLLIENARHKQSLKRGGQYDRVDIEVDVAIAGRSEDLDLLALNEALDKLNEVDPQKVRVVELHHFAGLTMQETADALGVSLATAKRYWTYARAWLRREVER